jgi:DNA-binding transcriptional MerR regulator
MDRKLDASFSGLEAFSAGDSSLGEAPRTIGEMARIFGLTPRALRFYEAKGLLSPKRNGAARLYGGAEHKRLAVVLKAKQLGFTLGEIRQMLAAPDEPPETSELNISRRQCFEQIRLLEQRKREIDAALAELRRTYSSFYARIVEGAKRQSA